MLEIIETLLDDRIEVSRKDDNLILFSEDKQREYVLHGVLKNNGWLNLLREVQKQYGRAFAEYLGSQTTEDMVSSPSLAPEFVTAVFRRFECGDVIAFFPDVPGNRKDPDSVMSYQHTGQHGHADIGLIDELNHATDAEIKELAGELERMGYIWEIKDYPTEHDHETRELCAVLHP